MSEIDIDSRLEELEYYQKVTKKLATKFENLIKCSSLIQSHANVKVQKSLVSSSTETYAEPTCTECSVKKSSCGQGSQSTSKPTVCSTCLSTSTTDDYSPIWLLSRSEKLQIYENALTDGGRLTEPEMTVSVDDGLASTSSKDQKRTFAEITKYERDVKRKRMKHRTTKAPPLTHTEELRGLISLQTELWQDYVVKSKRVKR